MAGQIGCGILSVFYLSFWIGFCLQILRGGEACLALEGLGEGVDIRITEGKGDFAEGIVVALEHFFRLRDAQVMNVGDGRRARDAQEKLSKIHR